MNNKLTLSNIKHFLLLLLLISSSANSDTLRLATTTSTENSGLLKVLLPEFEKASSYKVHVIAVGTGKALHMGQAGDADVILVHSRKAEEKFIADMHGVNHRSVMYNDFVIVGPENDPANISATTNAVQALNNIARAKVMFISRGDNSGTHKKELLLWQSASTKPDVNWYREAGQGMGKVLQMADELSAYTLTDRGTWLSVAQKSSLKVLFEGDKRLFNPYGVIAVNPDKYHDINYLGAMSFIAWLTSPKAQQMIANYRINNKVLFTPMAVLSIQ
ncbi:MAG: substrate-binding domain-containing protein [Gammaproteobacteria bacterium]|nr:substrate-binding domain-containing protein [Gammaproteobacteria bacterium]